MLVKLKPRDVDKLGDQIDLANELLTKDYVDEVQLQMNDGTHYMRQPMDGDQIRKFIWEGYDNDSCGVMYNINELKVVLFFSKLYVTYNDKIVFSTVPFYQNDQNKITNFGTVSLQDALESEYEDTEYVIRSLIEWGEEHIVNFREDFNY